MRGYRDVLAIRRYRWLWLGDTVSSLGDSVSFVALVWIVFETSGSSSTLGWFVAAYTAPVIVGGPLVGVVLDRFDRRRLLIADNLCRTGLMALVPLLHYAGVLAVWHLYLVAIAYGLLKMFPLAGVPALIPDLVPDDGLDAANALESVAFFLSSVTGAAVGGVLVAAVGGANALWLDAGSYAFFALALWRMGSVSRDAAPRPEPSGAPSLRAAASFLLRTPVILATTLMFMLVNVGEPVRPLPRSRARRRSSSHSGSSRSGLSSLARSPSGRRPFECGSSRPACGAAPSGSCAPSCNRRSPWARCSPRLCSRAAASPRLRSQWAPCSSCRRSWLCRPGCSTATGP